MLAVMFGWVCRKTFLKKRFLVEFLGGSQNSLKIEAEILSGTCKASSPSPKKFKSSSSTGQPQPNQHLEKGCGDTHAQTFLQTWVQQAKQKTPKGHHRGANPEPPQLVLPPPQKKDSDQNPDPGHSLAANAPLPNFLRMLGAMATTTAQIDI